MWISTEEFFRFMRASGADFIVTDNSWDIYICSPHYGSLGHGCGWILEERYLLGLLLEYAATLGLLDVALIPPAGARADYGDLWGTDELSFFSRYDGLRTCSPQRRRASPPNAERGGTGSSANEGGEFDEAGALSVDRTVGRVSDILQAVEAKAGD